MNLLPTATGKLALLVFLAMPLQAADQVTRLFAKPGSKVTINGSNNFHIWEVQGKETDGWVEFGAGFPTMTGQMVKLGKMQARMEGSIPVRSLHSNEGKRMDEAMYHLLKEEVNPRICFRFSELSLKAMPKSNDDPYLFDSRGELVVAGVTNRISTPIGMIPLGGQKLKMTGSTSVKMTNLGIQPPEIKLPGANETLRYRDEIKLSFEWFVGPKAAP